MGPAGYVCMGPAEKVGIGVCGTSRVCVYGIVGMAAIVILAYSTRTIMHREHAESGPKITTSPVDY